MSVTQSDPRPAQDVIETDIPFRLDALPFGRFHVLVVVALGVTWILDGLEVTLTGAVAGALKERTGLGLSDAEIGFAGSAYLAGAVLGALAFGRLTDRHGRRLLFFVTLGVYLAGTLATAASWDATSFAIFRFIVGCGVGGEYAAVNSAIQELIPARVRGWTDLVINGAFWIGAAMGAAGSLALLDPNLVDPAFGWRLAFLIGGALGAIILFVRRWIPESPRWLVLHGREREAEAVMETIESGFDNPPHRDHPPKMRLHARAYTPLVEIVRALLFKHRRRALVGLSLMASQAFLFNAVFFTYALILTNFYGVENRSLGWHLLALSIVNFCGPLTLGRFFDTIGRRIMITATYAISGAALIVVGWMFARQELSATQLTLGWMLVFFFASAAASSAYLTVSETFPLEMRAMAIAVFYAVGTAVGGVVSPWLFGTLIGTGSRLGVFEGYAIGATLMLAAAALEWRFGVDAERKPLEQVAAPLSLVDADGGND